MGGPSRNRVYLVQRFKRDAAKRLTLEQAKVAIENWNAAIAAGGDVHPSRRSP